MKMEECMDAVMTQAVEDDSQLNIVDLLKKYKIDYVNGKYLWGGEVYDSYREPLRKAQGKSERGTKRIADAASGQPSVGAESEERDNGFFAAEREGINNGVVGGIFMIVIALLWFFIGWAAGYIFFYPPILGVIGVYAVLKGIFTGNVSGKLC